MSSSLSGQICTSWSCSVLIKNAKPQSKSIKRKKFDSITKVYSGKKLHLKNVLNVAAAADLIVIVGVVGGKGLITPWPGWGPQNR